MLGSWNIEYQVTITIEVPPNFMKSTLNESKCGLECPGKLTIHSGFHIIGMAEVFHIYQRLIERIFAGQIYFTAALGSLDEVDERERTLVDNVPIEFL